MRSFLWVAAAALLISYSDAAVLEAQMLPPPITQGSPQSLLYASPYGPRAMPSGPSANKYQFHFGVDYSYAYGTPIYAVEAGTFIKIKRDGANDWVLGIAGNHYFSYIHIFNDGWMGVTLPKDHEGNKIWAQQCLNSSIFNPVVMYAGLSPFPLPNVSDSSCANKSDLVTLEDSGCFDPQAFAIVFWQDFDHDVADRVLSPCTLYKIGGKQETAAISQGDWIALVGNSGEADHGVTPGGVALGSHLHLQVDSGDENPLLFVQHDSGAPPGYDLLIFKDKGSDILTLNNNEDELNGDGTPPVLNPAQDSPLLIRTEVIYSNAGHDLDKVGMFMFNKNSPNPYTGFCMGAGGVTPAACFDYGGNPVGPDGITSGRDVFPVPPQPDDDRNEDLSVAVQQGVYPQPGRGGVVDFLTDPINLTQVNPGSYLILVKTLDVLNEELDQGPIEVEVPPKLTITVSGDGTVSSNPAGLNSGISDCGAGQVCFDWFDIKNGVTLTAVPNSTSVPFQGWGVDCTGSDTTITVFTPSPTPQSKTCTANFTTINFAGNWNTTYGAMSLGQNGNIVTGTYAGGFNGTVNGTVTTDPDGDLTLSALWFDDTGTGSLTFHLAPDGNSFFGSWLRFTGSGNPGGGWCGARIGSGSILGSC